MVHFHILGSVPLLIEMLKAQLYHVRDTCNLDTGQDPLGTSQGLIWLEEVVVGLFESVVRGHHIYKEVRTPRTREEWSRRDH